MVTPPSQYPLPLRWLWQCCNTDHSPPLVACAHHTRFITHSNNSQKYDDLDEEMEICSQSNQHEPTGSMFQSLQLLSNLIENLHRHMRTPNEEQSKIYTSVQHLSQNLNWNSDMCILCQISKMRKGFTINVLETDNQLYIFIPPQPAWGGGRQLREKQTDKKVKPGSRVSLPGPKIRSIVGLTPQAGGGAMQTRGMPSPQNCGWGSCLLSTKLLGSPLGKTGQAMEPCHVCHDNQIS